MVGVLTPQKSANDTIRALSLEDQYTSTPLVLIHHKFSAGTQTLQNVVLGTVFRSLDGLGPFQAWLRKAYLLDGALMLTVFWCSGLHAVA